MTTATEESVLDPVRHARLVHDLDHLCQVANINPSYVRRSAVPFLDPITLDWLYHFRAYKAQGVAGLIFQGLQSTAPDVKMMAITGALMRNFIDARILTTKTLIDASERNDVPDPPVMLIPNLHVRTVGKHLPDWEVQTLYDILLARFSRGQTTIAYVEDMDALKQSYGPVFSRHLTSHYRLI